MKRIAVVHTVTFEAADWERVESLGPWRYTPGYPASEAELAERIGDAQVVIGADVAFSAAVLEATPHLELISIWGTGTDNVDLGAAHRLGIRVCNVPGYSAYSVAEHSWAMGLHLLKKLGPADEHVRSGRFDWSAIEGLELYGKTIGIIGLGATGTRSAAIARGFGCRVMAVTRHPTIQRAAEAGVSFVSLDELLAQSEMIHLHVPLTPETRGLIDAEAFARMARRPVLLNTARGAVIDLPACVEAVETGQVRGLGLDVLWQEPPDWEDPLLRRLMACPQVIFSPHCASHTQAAFERMTRICLDNVALFLNGGIQNRVG